MGNTAYSSMKVLYHTEKIEDLKNGIRTAPVYIRIKPTNVCNQRCYYCVYADNQVFESRKVDRRESIPWEKMQEIIRDMEEMGVKAVTFSGGGEPLCYHSMIPALELLKKTDMDYSMITNGQELRGEKAELLYDAKWIRVSLDSPRREVYRRIRGVDTYDQVIENLRNFARNKNQNCQLGINLVVTKDNAGDVFAFCAQMKEIGVNNVKVSPLMVRETTAKYHSGIKDAVQEQLERAKQLFVTDSFAVIDKYSDDLMLDANFKKSYRTCYMKELFTVIGADQKVYFCHQKAYRPDGIVGDIREKSLKEVWFSQDTTDRFLNMDAKKECDFRCAFEERNVLLNDLFGLDKNHVNFI